MDDTLFPYNGKNIDVLIKEDVDGCFNLWANIDIGFLREIPGVVNENINYSFQYKTFYIDPRYNTDIVLKNLQYYFDKISARKLSYNIIRHDYD